MKYSQLVDILKTYMTEENINIVDSYYKESLKIYDKMKLTTGEDYVVHPINVAIILAELKMNAKTIGCALIHEAIKLDKMSYEEICEKFDEESAIIVNAISKLSNLKRTFIKNDVEKSRRIVVALSEHPISLFIKLADRLDNLRNIQFNDKKYIENVVDETEKIFIPIAHRLGIKTMKSELEDLCLKLSNPELYESVLNKINADKEELDKSLLKMKDEIVSILNENNIKFEILYRVKSVRGIYNKLKTGRKWEEIYDLLGLRILLEKTEECYLVVGLIHSKFRPIPKRFKDYIANPKNNMYQSLHTTVFGSDGRIYEVQIRTHEMNEIAEHGVASHWSYKEKTDGRKSSYLEDKLAEFRTLIEVNDKEGNVDFFKNFKTNIVKENIYVFTPKGDIIELPIDSTPIDFAYKIHSEIGNETSSSLVNGKQVRLDYKLQDGDIVDLKTLKGKGPSKAWLKFVKTESAKSRIKAYWSKKEKEKTITTGKEIFLSELKKHKLNEKDIEENILNEFLKEMKVDNINEIFIGISTYKYTPNVIVNKLINKCFPKKDEKIDKLLDNKTLLKNKENGNILVQGQSDILTTLATCCNPVLGDEIVGYITKGNGVLVHRSNCKNVNLNDERIIDVAWNNNKSEVFISSICVYIDSSNDHLVDILTIATKIDIQLTSINNKGKVKNDDVYELICKVKDLNSLKKFMSELESLNFVSKVER